MVVGLQYVFELVSSQGPIHILLFQVLLGIGSL